MADGAAVSSDAPKKRGVSAAFDSKNVTKKKKSGELIQEPAPTAKKYTALPPGFNLAGRPEQLKHRNGIKRAETKVETPYQTGNINSTSYWQFVIKSNKEEWIRFNVDSISLTVYGTYANPTYEENSVVGNNKYKDLALLASKGAPFMYLDPSILGASFAYKAEVYINNQMVPTNSAIGSLFQHYIRCARVYHSRAKNYFATNTDINAAGIENNATMKLATAAFDYSDPLTNRGTRIPLYMDGVFPFDRKNRTIESIDQIKEQSLFFPPDTEIIVKLHIYRSKMEAIFHTTMNVANYYQVSYVFSKISCEVLKIPFKEEEQIQSKNITKAVVSQEESKINSVNSTIKPERQLYPPKNTFLTSETPFQKESQKAIISPNIPIVNQPNLTTQQQKIASPVKKQELKLQEEKRSSACILF